MGRLWQVVGCGLVGAIYMTACGGGDGDSGDNGSPAGQNNGASSGPGTSGDSGSPGANGASSGNGSGSNGSGSSGTNSSGSTGSGSSNTTGNSTSNGSSGSANGSSSGTNGGGSGESGSSSSNGSAGSANGSTNNGSSNDTTGNNGSTNNNGSNGSIDNPLTDPLDGPPAGNPDGSCAIPAEAGLEDTSSPDTVVGDGTPESCTGDAFIDAVAGGGIITFDCGSDPVTITVDRPAKIVNDTGPEIVIDGGGLITLSGGGTTRILYMNTCDENQKFTTSHCQNQDHPRLTVQNITFIDANSKSEDEYDGGGAIWVRGGRFKAVNSRFFNNVCADAGPDLGGAGIRVLSQHEGLPVYVVNSTFGGAEGFGNTCSNGGGISSIGVSWTVINSVFTHNEAIGNGGNPAQAGTPGGGSGGAIYNDGNEMTLSLCGTRIEHNEVVQHGSAIFFVSNDHTGDVVIEDSTITNNVGGSWYPTYPQISNHDDTPIQVTDSTIE